MFFVAAGSLLASGLLCFWISLTLLIDLDEPEIQAPEPPKEDEKEEEKPRLTRLGRPMEQIRLQA